MTYEQQKKLENQLRDAVAKLSAKGGKSPKAIRAIVEDAFENANVESDVGAIVNQYAHTFFGLKQESAVDQNYCRLYVSNVIDAARGKN